jgi:hypothetical protein
MQNLALRIFAEFENHGIQSITYPADGPVLLRNIGALFEPIGMGEQFLRFFKPDPTPRIRPESLAFSRVESETRITIIPNNSYTTLQG